MRRLGGLENHHDDRTEDYPRWPSANFHTFTAALKKYWESWAVPRPSRRPVGWRRTSVASRQWPGT